MKAKIYLVIALGFVLSYALFVLFAPAQAPVVETSKVLDKPIAKSAERVEAVKVQARHSASAVAVARAAATEAGRIYHGVGAKAQDGIDSALARKANVRAGLPWAPSCDQDEKQKQGRMLPVPTEAADYIEKLETLTEAQDAHIANQDAVIQAEEAHDELLTAQNTQLKGEETQLQNEVKQNERKVFWAKVAALIVLGLVGAHYFIPGAL